MTAMGRLPAEDQLEGSFPEEPPETCQSGSHPNVAVDAILNCLETLDEAIAEANRLPFGLASYAFTGRWKLSTGSRQGRSRHDDHQPHRPGAARGAVGGIKDSGYGVESGSEATQAYMVTKFATSSAG